MYVSYRQSVAASRGQFLADVCTQHGLSDETLHSLYTEGITSEAALAAVTPQNVKILNLTDGQEIILIGAAKQAKNNVAIRY